MYGWYAWKRNWTWQRRRSKTKLGQEGENVKEILVVGGGAAGIAAALSAAEAGGRVTILEGLNRPGKKLLVTGNGRCNLGNTRIAPECYHTARPDRLKVLLKQMPATLTTDFFERWGLMTMADEAGRLYPYCRQASMVVDVLLLALQRRGVAVETDCTVTEAFWDRGGFTVKSSQGSRWRSDALILAAGGKAAPKQGLNGGGYALAKGFGHSCTPLYPCLTALRCTHPALRGLKGIRVLCTVALCAGGREIARESGELQLTEYGVSGIPAMQLSCRLGAQKGANVSVDFFPDCSMRALYTLLRRRAEECPDSTLEDAFLGLLHKRIMYALMKEAGLSPLSRTVRTLRPEELARLAELLKNWRLPVEGPMGWEQAQVTGGGIALQEIGDDFQSRCCSGLYLAGEVLDVAGECGGYNLHWAWCSGILAGRRAVGEAEL